MKIMKRVLTVLLAVFALVLLSIGVASADVTGDGPGGDLIVSGQSHTIAGDHQGPNAYKSITVSDGGTLYIQPDDTVDGAVIDVNAPGGIGKVTVTGNSSIITKAYNTTNSDGKGVTINAADIQIDSGSTIDASGQGYPGGTGPGAGTSAYFAGGGGYGGKGGDGLGSDYWGGVGGFPYGSAASPIDLGSGGGNRTVFVSGPGGAGGGAIKLVISGTLTNNGTIDISGDDGPGWWDSGGGSGGSIWIDVVTLEGTGSINANGGGGWDAGSGSGGRIAVYYRDNKAGWTGSLSVASGGGHHPGESGSIVLQVPNPDLSSQSHLVDAWSNDNTIDISISNAPSGIVGYSALWSKESPLDPPANINMQPNATSTTSQPVEDGIWYFNIKARGSGGDWAPSLNLGPFKVDTASPQITISTPTEGAEYLLNANIVANWSATDALSGASATGMVPSGQRIDTSRPGANIFTVVAIDLAGNQTVQSVTYYVRYNYGGILQPINPDGSSIFKSNGNSIVPVKFQLKDAGGNFVGSAVAGISSIWLSAASGQDNESVVTDAATPGTLFIYDPSVDKYVYNLASTAQAPGTWQVNIALDDGTTKTTTFSVK